MSANLPVCGQNSISSLAVIEFIFVRDLQNDLNVKFPRPCLICKVPRLPPDVLCDHCMSGLARLREPITREEGRLQIRSLFAWRRNGPRALPWLVHSLKRRDDPQFWRGLAVEMLAQFGSIEKAAFVPIPSAGRNHAYGLARALSLLTGSALHPALSLPGERRAQKTLSRGARHDTYFERELWSFYNPDTTVVIVDDVVTTGATLRAAYHCLGRPKHCQAWCLLDRRPCGA